MFSDKTQMLIILVMAAAHVLVSGMMVVASFTSKDKGMKKCGGIWILSSSCMCGYYPNLFNYAIQRYVKYINNFIMYIIKYIIIKYIIIKLRTIIFFPTFRRCFF